MNKHLKQAREVAGLLKSLAHPRRLLALCYLGDGEKTLGQIQEVLGVEQAVASQIMARLRLQKMVVADKRGQQVFYRVADKRTLELLRVMAELYCKELIT